ncbi:MAG TPA: hypothetical protein VKX17_05785 [Planctomycetota bacterium]|nr:hypothetical protein [Planctomycetota bacterium]
MEQVAAKETGKIAWALHAMRSRIKPQRGIQTPAAIALRTEPTQCLGVNFNRRFHETRGLAQDGILEKVSRQRRNVRRIYFGIGQRVNPLPVGL